MPSGLHCYGASGIKKHRYKIRAAAINYLVRTGRIRTATVYKCVDCRGFHITHVGR